MKKVKLNKKLFLNKDVVSNLSGKHLIGVQGGTVQNCHRVIPNHNYIKDTIDDCPLPLTTNCRTWGGECDIDNTLECSRAVEAECRRPSGSICQDVC